MNEKTLAYSKTVEDHFFDPQNVAPGPCLDSVCGEGGSVESGAWIEFQLKLNGARIQHARFRAYGCPHTLALASWLTERLAGEQLDHDYSLDKNAVVEALHLPTEKMRSVLVAEDALRDCASKLKTSLKPPLKPLEEL